MFVLVQGFVSDHTLFRAVGDTFSTQATGRCVGLAHVSVFQYSSMMLCRWYSLLERIASHEWLTVEWHHGM